MTSVERSAERGSALGVEGIARLDVVLRENELEWRHITDAIAVNVVVLCKQAAAFLSSDSESAVF